MKILLGGDSHGDWRFLSDLQVRAQQQEAEVILILGDFGFFPHWNHWQRILDLPKPVPIYFLDGNHEDHSILDTSATEVIQIADNLFYLPRGYKWEWEGVSMMSLGGAHSVDRAVRVLDYDWFLEEELTEEDVDRATAHQSVDILFTHDCPSVISPSQLLGRTVNTIEAAERNRSKLTQVMYSLNPKRVYHGHWHHYHQTVVTLYEVEHNCTITGLDCNQATSDNWTILDLHLFKEENCTC